MCGRGAIRGDRSWPHTGPVQAMLEAVLTISGEVGYSQISAQEIVRRSGASRSSFYRHFEGEEDCFAQAYEVAAERLYEDMLDAAGSRPDWREGLRAGLTELIGFVIEQPAVAKALLIEARYANTAVRAKQTEVFERLSYAIDSARRETDMSRHSPPPMTGTLMVSAIEYAVCEQLAKGKARALWLSYPDMVQFVVLPYFGEDLAWEDFDTATAEAARRTEVQAGQGSP
jgi:AcrR family transcriptional regulator